CCGVFLPVALLPGGRGPGGTRETLAVVPPLLGDPAAWRAFAALGRRVEAPGDAGAAALAAARTTLGPGGAAAWSEADDLWERGAGGDAWRTAARGWDAAVRDALAAVGASADTAPPR